MSTDVRRIQQLTADWKPRVALDALAGHDEPDEFLSNGLGTLERFLTDSSPDGELSLRYQTSPLNRRLDALLRFPNYSPENPLDELVPEDRLPEASADFEIHTYEDPSGVPTVLATMTCHENHDPGLFEWGTWSRPVDGTACGDLAAVVRVDNGSTLLVTDGIGHGKEALEASHKALETICQQGSASIEGMVEALHESLRSSRGVVGFVGRMYPDDRGLEYCCVGDVRAYRIGKDHEELRSLNGTIGYRLPELRSFHQSFEPDDWLVVHTDGVRSPEPRVYDRAFRSRSPGINAARLLYEYSRQDDDALVFAGRLNSLEPRGEGK